MKSGIYAIRNKKNNKKYIGVSRDVYKRKKEHFYKLGRGRHVNRLLQGDYDLYGVSAFEFTVLKKAPIDKLFDMEKEYIKRYNSFGGGYNLTTGGDGTHGHVVSEETRKRLSLMNTGENNPNWGRKLSREHKEALIKATKSRPSYWKGKKLPQEMKDKISKAHMGIKNSKETRMKISSANKGKTSHWKGKTFSKEYRNKLSEAQKGIGLSDEAKRKLSLHNRGEGTNFHKLKEKQVIEAKVRMLKGERVMKLSKEYGVTRQCLYAIRKGNTWKYLPNTVEELIKLQEA